MEYAIPAQKADTLRPGTWVEIFKAWGEDDGHSPIRVQVMRVAGNLLEFDQPPGASRPSRPLRPHEGQIIAVQRRNEDLCFRIRLNS